MKIEITSHGLLSEVLRAQGARLDLRCGGRGICGRCKVKVLSGTWRSFGREFQAPAELLACRTTLLSGSGTVELPEPPSEKGVVETAWRNLRPLPDNFRPVLALDIGTTTLAAVRIEHGRVTARRGGLNGQYIFGDNVIERIAGARKDLKALQNAVLDSAWILLKELGLEDASRLAVAGNTAMTLLFHGVDPEALGYSPFMPPQKIFPERRDLFGSIPVVTVPCISGFLGGDVTAGLAETPLEPGDLFMDLGTNCEMVFAAPEGFIGTAAAAGPAFEGCGISCGMRAEPGAVSRYFPGGQAETIGGEVPRGICGSGLIDLLAVWRKEGKLSKFGRFMPPSPEKEVVPGVRLRESDVEQLLKAKAAAGAAVKALEEHCGYALRRVRLAGGFACNIDIANSRAIGLLPGVPCEISGNTSLAGAARLAADPGYMEELLRVSSLPREIPCNELEHFTENFTEALALPQ